MIFVEGHWERADTLEDVSKIVREYYNDELANVLDGLIESQEDEIKRLEHLVDELDNW